MVMRAGLFGRARPIVKKEVGGWIRRMQSTASSSNSTLQEASKLSASEKATLDTAEDELELTTGIIQKSSKEGLLYFDHLYPRLLKFGPVSMDGIVNKVLGLDGDKLHQTLTKHCVPEDSPLKLTKVTPRMKDGGAFARFSVDEEMAGNENWNTQKIETTLAKYFNERGFRPWYNSPLSPVRVFPVRGTPWIEDLRRSRNSNLKVYFEGEDISQEALYSVFRRYGPIMDIIPPEPGDPEPRSAQVNFSYKTDAATARNCVNGLSLKGGKTKLHISFEKTDRQNALFKWLVEHPRIVIPVLFALLATLAVMIFEPIRAFSIRHKITGRYVVLDGYPTLNKIKNIIFGFFTKVHGYVDDSLTSIGWKDGAGYNPMEHLWDARKEAINTLKQWVKEGADTFIVVYGPRGSGKDSLVQNQALKDRENVLTIDCSALVKSRSDSAFLKAASRSLGYYPVFPWMNSISTFLDLIAQGLTGQKTGFSESIETQFKNMLTTAATAVSQSALEKRAKNQDGTRENYLQLHPENKPVIVIRNLVSRSEEKNSFVYTQLAEWAAGLIQANVAHVVFVTDDVAYDKVLEKSLPNQVFKVLPVGDANRTAAYNFVLEQVRANQRQKRKEKEEAEEMGEETKKRKDKEPSIRLEGLEEALEPIGGRMTDLQAFSRRLKSGETPHHAVADMIEQAKVEVLLMFVTKATKQWTKEQAWTLIKMLAAQEDMDKKPHQSNNHSFFGIGKGEEEEEEEQDRSSSKNNKDEHKPIWLPLNTLSQDSNFSSPQQQESLNELENSEMIKLRTEAGRIIAIRAGKPLYQAAFTSLAKDASLSAWMESQILNMMISKESSSIREYEMELESLAKLPSKWEIKSRIDYLSTKLHGCQERIEGYEKELAHQKKVIQKTKGN